MGVPSIHNTSVILFHCTGYTYATRYFALNENEIVSTFISVSLSLELLFHVGAAIILNIGSSEPEEPQQL